MVLFVFAQREYISKLLICVVFLPRTHTFLLVCLFFSTFCLFPCQVDTSLVHFVCSVIARILAFTNSCLNPFALYLLSKTFKKQFNQQLCCCCPMLLKHSSQSPAHYNTHVTSVRSTHHSMASLSMINGRQLYQEDFV